MSIGERAPASGHTRALIRSLLPSLVPSEARVADVLLERPSEVVDWSVAELALAAGVSPATVVRACQSLGFRGFQQVRVLLAREVGLLAPQLSESIGPDDEPAAIVDKMFAAGARGLSQALTTLDRAAFGAAVAALTSAPRVLFSGSGTSSALCQDAVFRFGSSGRPVEAPADTLTAHVIARLLGPGDVCVAVSHTGANALTIDVAQAALDAGATVVGITSFARAPLVDLADIPLVVGVADLGFHADSLATRLGHVLLIDALVVAVALRAGGRDGARQKAFTAMAGYAYDPRRARG